MRRRNAGASGRWRKHKGGKNNKARKTATDSQGRKLTLTVENRSYTDKNGKRQSRTVYVVSGFAKGKKEYLNPQNAYDRMARWEGDAGFKSKSYDRAGTAWAKDRKSKKRKGSSAKRTSGKKPSAKAQAGITLRRLGYTGKLSGKNLDTLAKRNKKIKALRSKGRTMKAYEGIERANPRRQAGASQMHARRHNALSFRRNPAEILDMYLAEEDLY